MNEISFTPGPDANELYVDDMESRHADGEIERLAKACATRCIEPIWALFPSEPAMLTVKTQFTRNILSVIREVRDAEKAAALRVMNDWIARAKATQICNSEHGRTGYQCEKCEDKVVVCAECHEILVPCGCGYCPKGNTFYESD